MELLDDCNDIVSSLADLFVFLLFFALFVVLMLTTNPLLPAAFFHYSCAQYDVPTDEQVWGFDTISLFPFFSFSKEQKLWVCPNLILWKNVKIKNWLFTRLDGGKGEGDKAYIKVQFLCLQIKSILTPHYLSILELKLVL